MATPKDIVSQTFIVHIHGVTYPNDDGSSRQDAVARCRVGETLCLRAEPENQHDRFAVAVLNAAGQQVGYLPSDARDASAILRGEPIEAHVLKVIGGPRWWHRFFRIERSYGLLVRLTKGEPDWSRFNAYRDRAAKVDAAVDKALGAEGQGRIDEAIALYSDVLAEIERMNVEDPQASAHRYRAAPVNRLSLLLDRAGKHAEALTAIERWKTVPDPIGLGKADAEAVAKRATRLRRANDKVRPRH